MAAVAAVAVIRGGGGGGGYTGTGPAGDISISILDLMSNQIKCGDIEGNFLNLNYLLFLIYIFSINVFATDYTDDANKV